MTALLIIISIVTVVVAALMILAVLIQNSKGGGISSAFGGSAAAATQVLGGRRSNELIEKVTWGLAIIMVVLSLSANLVLGLSSADPGARLRMGSAIENQIIDAPISLPSQESFQGPSGE